MTRQGLALLALLASACGGTAPEAQEVAPSDRPVETPPVNPYASVALDGEDRACVAPGAVCAKECCSGSWCIQSADLHNAWIGRCASFCKRDADCQSGCCFNAGTLGRVCQPESLCK